MTAILEPVTAPVSPVVRRQQPPTPVFQRRAPAFVTYHPAQRPSSHPQQTTPAAPRQPNTASLALQEWVAPAACGDREALTQLLALLRPMVVRYCQARMTRWEVDIVTADDVAQDVCLAVCHSLPRYRYDNQFFLGYVYGIAAHKITDVRRAAVRHRAQPLPEAPEVVDEDAGPEQLAVLSEQRARLFALLDTLSPDHRRVLMLRIVRGLSAQETADAIGSTAGAVRVAQHRALNKLRAEFTSPAACQELITSLRATA